MTKAAVPRTFCEGALIVNGLIPETHLWTELNEFLNEIEELPQPIPWNGMSAWQLHMSVHRKTRNDCIRPPLEWAAASLYSASACAAIAFRCEPMRNDVQEFPDHFAKSLFHDLARAFTFAANISRPGCLSVHSIVMRNSHDSSEEDSGLRHDLEGAVDYSRKTGWPSLSPVPFGSVWFWIIRNLFHLRAGDTPVSRAFNAYTWLFERKSFFPFILVSALIGIEALFATTTSGVIDQVRRRAQLLLGSRTTFKKDLDKMYAARSAFLHGSTLLSPNGFSWEPPKTVETKLSEISEAEDVAGAVLVSSLQRLAEKGWTKLEFSENIAGSDEEDLTPVEEIIRGNSMPCAWSSEIDDWMAQFFRRFD